MLAFLPIVQGHQGQLRHQLPIVLIARRLVALGGFFLGDLCAYGLNLGGDSGAGLRAQGAVGDAG